MFKILDLFSGAGGFSHGFEMNKNFKVVLATDYNFDALKTFKKNHKKVEIIFGDITNPKIKKEIIDKSKELLVDFIIGGPPCQGFSIKGKKKGLLDERNFLFLEFLEIVKNVKPKIFVMENVPSIVSAADGYFIKEIKNSFENLGYVVNFDILNSSDFGVPQSRRRAFIVGSLIGKFDLPKSKNKKNVTIYDAISDLNYLESGNIQHEREYLYSSKSSYQNKMRKNSKKLFNHSSTKHTEESLKKLLMIPEKGTKLDLPIHLRTRQKFKNTWSRLHWDKVSPTIDTRFDTPSNGQNIHPILNRAITPREAARIQSFNDDYEFLGCKSSICKQIGNAVPPFLAYAIANAIWKQHKEIEEFTTEKYKIYWADSLKISSFIEDNSIHALITDPPYNISKKNNFHTLRNKRQGVDFGEWDKNFDTNSWIDNFYSKLIPGGAIIIFCSYLSISFICDKLIQHGAIIKDTLKWIKSNPMPRNVERRYVSDTEFAIWAVKPGAKWTFNKPRDKFYLRAEFKTSTVSGKERLNHPTQKSLRLMKDIISIHTKRGDIILDPFMGTATTGIASIELDRKFIGIEKDKVFFSLAYKRLKK